MEKLAGILPALSVPVPEAECCAGEDSQQQQNEDDILDIVAPPLEELRQRAPGDINAAHGRPPL